MLLQISAYHKVPRPRKFVKRRLNISSINQSYQFFCAQARRERRLAEESDRAHQRIQEEQSGGDQAGAYSVQGIFASFDLKRGPMYDVTESRVLVG